MGGVIMNERICTPPLEGLRRGDAHTNENTQHNTLAQVPNRIPASCNPTSYHKTSPSPSPSPPPASYDRWQYAWSTNCSTTPSASRGGPHRKRTLAGPCAALAHIPPNRVVAQRRARPARRPTTAAARGHRRAADRWHVACSGRSWSRCAAARACRADLVLRPTPLPPPSQPQSRPSDRPAPRARTPRRRGRPRSAARPTRARTRAASAPCSAGSRAPRTRAPTAPAPRCGRICRARREPGALTSALQRCAARRRARRASVGAVCAGRGARGGGARVGQAKGRRWRGRGGG